jgi:hypothetical protein
MTYSVLCTDTLDNENEALEARWLPPPDVRHRVDARHQTLVEVNAMATDRGQWWLDVSSVVCNVSAFHVLMSVSYINGILVCHLLMTG